MSEKIGKQVIKPQMVFIEDLDQFEMLKKENSVLVSLNTMYKEQVSCLEVEISDLKAVIMAKDYEIKLALEKVKSPGVSKFSPVCKENWIKETIEGEARYLKLQLEEEKAVNKELCFKIKDLEDHIKKSEKENGLIKVERLDSIIQKLTNKYESGREKQSTPTFSNPESIVSESDSTKPQFSDFYIGSDLDSSAETLVPAIKSPQIFSSNFSKRKNSPNPSAYKNKSGAYVNKKSLTPGRIVKHFTCNLSEILSSSPRPVAGFCPSTIRKFKTDNSYIKHVN